jgi:hypothetical protein
MAERIAAGDTPPPPPPPDPPDQRSPAVSRELTDAYQENARPGSHGLETPGLQPSDGFRAGLNQHAADSLSHDSRTLPDQYYSASLPGDSRLADSPSAAARPADSPPAASRSADAPPAQPADTRDSSPASTPDRPGVIPQDQVPDQRPASMASMASPETRPGPDISPQYAIALSEMRTQPAEVSGQRPVADDHAPGGTDGTDGTQQFGRADLDSVKEHLAREGIDHCSANDVMPDRIDRSIANGTPHTEGQQNFMTHELTEKRLMDDGVPYAEAHEAALSTHPPFRNYDPEVIRQFSEMFNSNWYRAWGMEK